jgi:uroporphyrinogen-III synthase
VALPDLDGFTIGITADRRADEQAELLRRRGATVLLGPTIRTLPLAKEEALRDATDQVIVRPPDVLIANTGLGMRSWFGAADSWGIGDALLGALREAAIFSRGPKASGALYQAGLPVVGRAESERLGDVVDLVLAHGVAGRRVAFQRHGDEAPDAVAALIAAGAEVVEIPVYRWKLPDDDRPALKLISALLEGRLHAVTFTSAPAVRNLLSIADEHDLTDAVLAACNDSVVACCVGPVCAEAAVDCGFVSPLVPDKARLGPMVLTLSEHLVASRQRFVLAGTGVEVCGVVVRVDGERLELSDREAQLFRALLRRSGTVVPKSQLLAEVWGPDATDDHVVESTMARLRRRLGPVSAGVVAVPRRGYRVDATIDLVSTASVSDVVQR